MLQSAAGNLPQVQALLKHLPAGTPNGRTATFTLGGQTYTVPLSSMTGSATQQLDDNQGTMRIDHQLGQNHTLIGRYLFNTRPDRQHRRHRTGDAARA